MSWSKEAEKDGVVIIDINDDETAEILERKICDRLSGITAKELGYPENRKVNISVISIESNDKKIFVHYKAIIFEYYEIRAAIFAGM